jgi:hypothetical protein
MTQKSLARTRSCGLVGRNRFSFCNGRYTIRVANDRASRLRAYRLLFDVYQEKEYADPAIPSKMWLTAYDALPKTVTFLVECDALPVAALTAVPDSQRGLPADELYSPELDVLRARGCRIVELISFAAVVDPGEMSVPTMLFNAVYLYAYRVAWMTHFVMAVTPRHARFYRRALCFENLGSPRRHDKVNGTVGCLEYGDLSTGERMIIHEHGERGGSAVGRTLFRGFLGPADEADFVEMINQNVNPMSESDIRFFFGEEGAQALLSCARTSA